MRDNLLPYAANNSYDPDRNVVRNPQNLNMFRGRSYGTIIEALLMQLPPSARRLAGKLSPEGDRITSWGKEIGTPWFTQRQLAHLCFGIDPGLRKQLASRQSGDPYYELGQDIAVLQRTGGKPESRYAEPLMQALMCIDSQWIRRKGGRDKMYQLVVGRSVPRKGRVADAVSIVAA